MMGLIVVALGVLGLCSSASAASPDDLNVRGTFIATATGTDSVESWQPCESCEWAVRSIQDFVADPRHQEQLAEVLDSVACTIVPADAKDACDNKVDAAVKHAVQIFEDYVSPATVCKPVCPSEVSEDPKLPCGRYPACAQCEYNAMELASAGEGASVVETLEEACNKLPGPFVHACLHFVEMNGKALQDSIEANGQENACMGTGHCEIPEMTDTLSSVAVPQALKTAAANLASKLGAAQAKIVLADKETCEFCRLAVMEVREKISDPQFQHEVETYLKTICKSLGDYKNMCIQYVDEYGPIAFALVEDYLDPNSVCGAVHMCPS